MGCLYKLTSPDGKSYIGITLFSFEKRMREHVRSTSNSSVWALHVAIRKYGAESFTHQILATSDDWQELCRLESEAIVTHGTYGNAGYNMTSGGDGVVGLSDDAKRRHRANTASGTKKAWAETDLRSRIAITRDSDEYRRRHSEATSAGTYAAFQDPDVRARLRESRSRPDYRAKASASVKALWASPEYRSNQIAKRRGRTGERSAESIRAQSEKMKALIAERKAAGTYWLQAKKAP